MLAQLGRAAMVPLWTAQLLTGTKSFGRNRVIGSRWLNEQGLHAARVGLAHRVAAMRRHYLAGLVTDKDRAAFERDGFVIRPDFLPAGEFAELLRQVKAYRGPLREIGEGDTILRKIALDPKTLAALHADTFHPTVKAWLFLTDVAADAGPFTYVPGSHRLTRERLAWERRMSLAARHSPDPEIRQGSFRLAPSELPALGLPEPRLFAVPANTLIVADTFGFHARGPSAGRSVRVEIWAYGRRSPFVPWPGFDLWSGGALARRSLLGWRLGDLLDRAGVKPHRWRARTGISAFDPA